MFSGAQFIECALIESDKTVLEDLRRLSHRGFHIALDNFETDYFSLSYLIHNAPTQPKDRAIMEGAIFIGHRLGLEVMAEGLENAAQLSLLRDLVQGFFFRSMPALEIERLLSGFVGGHGGGLSG